MKSLFTLSLLVCFVCAMQSQIHIKGNWWPSDTTLAAKIVTKDKAWYKGNLRTLNDSIVTFKLKSGENFTINADEVESVRIFSLRGYNNNKSSFPTSQRLMSLPSAYGLSSGEFEYRNTNLFFNSVQYGISDRVSLGSGAFFVAPLIYTAWGNIKLNFKMTEGQHFAIGALAGRASLYGDDEPNDVGNYSMLYGAVSKTHKTGFLNFFVGRTMVSDNIYFNDDLGKWILSMGYSKVINTRTRINIEIGNYFPLKKAGMSLGINKLHPRSSWNFGVLLIPIDGESIAAVPFISRSVRWKNWKRITY